MKVLFFYRSFVVFDFTQLGGKLRDSYFYDKLVKCYVTFYLIIKLVFLQYRNMIQLLMLPFVAGLGLNHSGKFRKKYCFDMTYPLLYINLNFYPDFSPEKFSE